MANGFEYHIRAVPVPPPCRRVLSQGCWAWCGQFSWPSELSTSSPAVRQHPILHSVPVRELGLSSVQFSLAVMVNYQIY